MDDMRESYSMADGRATQAKEQFQLETLRSSELIRLVQRYAEIYSLDHYSEPWPKACQRCDLLRDTKALLERPINDEAARMTIQRAEKAEAALRQALDRVAKAEQDAARLRKWLDNNTTFTQSAGNENNIALASVSRRIWFHVTDDEGSYPFTAVIDTAMGGTP